MSEAQHEFLVSAVEIYVSTSAGAALRKVLVVVFHPRDALRSFLYLAAGSAKKE